jgi:DNA-binding NtrC family response regulator
MPLAMQSSLLRVLEQKAIRPVGAERELSVDVRIVAATNRNLKAEVEAGRFREDLFYRLNVVALPVAPLRDRVDDIPALVHHFTRQLTAEMGMGSLSWTHEDVVAMQAYPWPGNVRELRNLIERCLLLGKPPADYWQSNKAAEQGESEEGYPLAWPLAEVEKAHILQVVASHDGNKSAASRVLGVARKTLERKFKEWAIE